MNRLDERTQYYVGMNADVERAARQQDLRERCARDVAAYRAKCLRHALLVENIVIGVTYGVWIVLATLGVLWFLGKF